MRNEIIKIVAIMAVMAIMFVPIFFTARYGMLVGWLSMVAMTFACHFLMEDK